MQTILIVDDDVPVGNALEKVLTKSGYRVIRAYSGVEALKVLQDVRPDLVLLDLMMPGMNGEEVLPQVMGIPVIIMSSKSDMDTKVNLLYGGAVDYVTKPFDVRELLARISVHLSQKERRNTEELRMTVHSENKEIIQIPVSSVFYIEVVDNCVYVYTEEAVYKSPKRLYELEEELTGESFVRVSKSTLLNIKKVVALRSTLNSRVYAKLQNDEEVLVSRKYAKEVSVSWQQRN